MIVTLAYFCVLVAVIAYIANFGGRTGLCAGVLQLLTSLSTLVLALAIHDREALVVALAFTDLFSLAWKLALAFLSNRKWPIWVAAFQINVVAGQISVWIVPDWKGPIWYAMVTVWAVPSLLVMLTGTILDRRYDQKVDR